jgi:hypothetical protein
MKIILLEVMVLIMNKSDMKLVGVLLIVISLIFIFINVTKEEGGVAEVYYKDEIILNVDLSIDGEYVVDGELGDVILEVKDNKIRVKRENSPRNICSKEGFIGDSSRVLICLPNKITIKIVGESDIDGVVY